ncbi:MAG: ATP-binding protein [Coriobacteriales bacterium]|nr:ATP-binding protein [Coriobacteriales bacterium]
MSSERDSVTRVQSARPALRSRPTASIARSITWSFWWRKVLSWLCFDVLLITILAACFTWHCAEGLPTAALDGITYGSHGISVIDPRNIRFVGSMGDFVNWSYQIQGGDGITYSFAIAPFVQSIGPLLIASAVYQVLDLLDFFSDTRRVRRQLQPLNDLAVLADAIGMAGVVDPMVSPDDASKMATLEQAIARASVDSPTITTGDQDLRSIEVALNGLLRQMQEAKLQQMRFVSDASHELRTPIAVIQGYVNMLDRWGSTDEEVLHESIEALKAESEHMQELVEQLLFLARGDSGRNTLQRSDVNMAEIVCEVWDESCMIDESHRYVCKVSEQDAEDARYQFSGDLAMVKQVLRVIVQNAQKYSPEGSTITLGASATAHDVSFSVQDEGIGMSEEDAGHVFERFYRSDSARVENSGGTGLGLSIAKWIVDAHGGNIEVLSREGVGTRFTVHFPKEDS